MTDKDSLVKLYPTIYAQPSDENEIINKEILMNQPININDIDISKLTIKELNDLEDEIKEELKLREFNGMRKKRLRDDYETEKKKLIKMLNEEKTKMERKIKKSNLSKDDTSESETSSEEKKKK